MGRARIIAAVVTVLTGMALAAPAHAEVPGQNGSLVFARHNATTGDFEVWTSGSDGSNMQLIAPSPVECPRWSPDGSQLLVCPLTAAGLIRPAIADPDGSNLTFVPIQDPTINLGCAAWSSTGTLACESWDDAHPKRRPGIFTIDANGGGLHRVTMSTHKHPDLVGDFSPNGSRLVVERWTDPDRERGALYVVNTAGTWRHRITADGFAQDAGSWSPDGRWILFSNRRAKLWAVHPDGSGLHRIRLHPGGGGAFLAQPSWSPDGTRIVARVYLTTTRKLRVYTFAADGTDLQRVAGSTDRDEFADWGALDH